MDYSKIVECVGLNQEDIFEIFEYGSHVYGTNAPDSDKDIVVIVRDGVECSDHIECGEYDIQIIHQSVFKQKLYDHDIMALECFFLNTLMYPFDYYEFELDLSKLRNSISKTSSNSWVKCKKKLTVEENCRKIGIKSLFHSFRIPSFGIQFATKGKIINFSIANDLWFEEFQPMIEDESWTWERINSEYKQRHNQLMTEFRKVTKK